MMEIIREKCIDEGVEREYFVDVVDNIPTFSDREINVEELKEKLDKNPEERKKVRRRINRLKKEAERVKIALNQSEEKDIVEVDLENGRIMIKPSVCHIAHTDGFAFEQMLYGIRVCISITMVGFLLFWMGYDILEKIN